MTGVFRRRTQRLLNAAHRDESGISIIEVLAAALIFLMLSVVVAQATVLAIRLGADQKHRVTALSLAASEIDLVRAIGDPFDALMGDKTTTTTIDGIEYTIKRETSWVSGTGLDIPCGAGGTGNLQYKRINVRVEWAGQMAPRTPVSSDTIIAPDGRINDPAMGTIMVAATRADGTGAAGVSVSIAPANTDAVALDEQPAATNDEGCTYALQVTPGDYTVTLSRSGYISGDQEGSPSETVTVVAGSTVNAPFAYDQAANIAPNFAPGAAGVGFASNHSTSYVNTYGTYYVDGTSGSAPLFPYGSGYTPIAGTYVTPDPDGSGGCPAVDPAAWTADPDGALAAGIATESVVTTPGGNASVDIPMGVVRLNNVPRNRWIVAVSQSAGTVAGQPGCAAGLPHQTFSRVSTSNSTADRLIALPFGSWRLYYGGTGSSAPTGNPSSGNALPQNAITPISNVVPSGMVSGNLVTLDPRPAS